MIMHVALFQTTRLTYSSYFCGLTTSSEALHENEKGCETIQKFKIPSDR